ncbi:MAG TPA: peptidoglycan-associated lipoprotein Pal [Methylotenera sp.]|nr:peptidoglycan-associated lipoprotein Pal [Methylotenera sp.]
MNNLTFNKKLLSTLMLALVLTACKSTPLTKPSIEDKSVGQSTTSTAPAAKADDGSTVKEVSLDDANANDAGNPLKDPNNILSKRNIYFDFDSDAVKAEYRPLVEAHAKYLLSHKDAKVIVQGNADERGTREYNLALGQRRSVAVKKALNVLGVQDDQIETVSYGEEKSVGCADEACYSKDRRADIVYQGE